MYLISDEFKKFAKFRNGVESLPSTIIRRYHVNKIPVDELSDITFIQALHLIMQIFMNTISDKLLLLYLFSKLKYLTFNMIDNHNIT
jgi:hypothetical protein